MIRPPKHAQEALEKRAIALAWVEQAVAVPDFSRPDPHRPGITRSYKTIDEADGRILRVAHRPIGNDILVVTAHFDRNAQP